MSHTSATSTNTRRKLVDYTLSGKAVPQQVQPSRSFSDLPRDHNFCRNGSLRRYRSHDDQLATTSRRSESSTSLDLDLSNSSWNTPCDDADVEKISFYLKIPSRDSRKQTSDLRERFPSSRRPCKKASLLNAVIGGSQSRRSERTRNVALSF